MSRVKMRLTVFLSCLLLVGFSLALVAGCAPQQTASSGGSDTTASMPAEAGVYVSDEQCLSCHGNSYEALAQVTADLGDWNPHDSIHGGYNACDNCHEADKVISYNYCEPCHVYVPDTEALY